MFENICSKFQILITFIQIIRVYFHSFFLSFFILIIPLKIFIIKFTLLECFPNAFGTNSATAIAIFNCALLKVMTFSFTITTAIVAITESSNINSTIATRTDTNTRFSSGLSFR